MHPLDNPAWDALHGAHRQMAELRVLAGRYLPEVSRFGAFPGPPGPSHWDAMADLVGPEGSVILIGDNGTPPDGWAIDYDGFGVQMTGEQLGDGPADVAARRADLETVQLGGPDTADMMALVGRTRPGPFSPRTWELGGYAGIRIDGQLVAMAGQRLRPTGWCEISAVATDPDYRRRGLGEHLVRVVAAGIVARGEVPFLHTGVENGGAIRLYEAMGFVHRRRVHFVGTRARGASPGESKGA